MDASVMEGTGLRAGAVGAVERIKNPIRLARAVMEDGRHVLLVGADALSFARSRGIAECDPEILRVERQQRRYEAQVQTDGGTVGVVAVDREGHVAAATSTGGIMGKLPGRVGDSAVIGAGTYADDRCGAASATGVGEPIMRVTLARLAVDLLDGGRDPAWASQRALAILDERVDAHGGLVLVDTVGRVGIAFTTAGMPAAYMHAGLPTPVVA
jgi:beta-aspartyl-peptidase (threonine type)